jgi:DNA polymerase III subunit epsilon
MPFVAIDFETANETRASACQLGVAVWDGAELTSRSWLIRPPELRFSYHNIAVHGIRPGDVADEPELDAVWHEIAPYLAGRTVIAHNASFDMSVLRASLDTYGLPYPTLAYFCTVQFAKKVWPGLANHKLNTVARHIGVTFNHHDAEADALACAQVAMQCCRESATPSLAAFAGHHGISTGALHPGGYTPPRVAKRKR